MALENLITRHPTMDDLPGVVALIRAYDAVSGFDLGDPTDDIRQVWISDDFNLAEDAWLVMVEQGQVVGYLEADPDDNEIELDMYVHPDYLDAGIGEHFLALVDQKLAGSGKKATMTVPVSDKRITALFEGFGYRWSRGHWVMEIDLTEPPTLQWPEGVELRPFDQGRDAHTAYEVVMETFSWNRTGDPQPYEEWARRFERSDYDPSLYLMAWKGERCVGVSLNLFRRPDLGWVRTLGVREEMRGRGLGKALLHQSFTDFYRRGVPKVGLAVDSQNPTGATRLYQKVGMRIAEQYSELSKQF